MLILPTISDCKFKNLHIILSVKTAINILIFIIIITTIVINNNNDTSILKKKISCVSLESHCTGLGLNLGPSSFPPTDLTT